MLLICHHVFNVTLVPCVFRGYRFVDLIEISTTGVRGGTATSRAYDVSVAQRGRLLRSDFSTPYRLLLASLEFTPSPSFLNLLSSFTDSGTRGGARGDCCCSGGYR
jgi:hypothetical protein